ncbi:hypothetical protein [Bradyrhizobium diazoefficiens]
MTNWVWPVTLYLGKSLLVTLWISLLTVILATILGLLIAALSQKHAHVRALCRTALR